MTPEEMKEKLLELAKPLDDFMHEHDVASFYIGHKTFDVQCMRRPLPGRIKQTLKLNGSIYLIDTIKLNLRSSPSDGS